MATDSFDVNQALLRAYHTNDRINHYLIRNVPVEAWNMSPPGGKGRKIVAIAGHMHNVRLMWLKSAGAKQPFPAKLEGDDLSQQDVINAMTASCQAIHDVVESSLQGGGKIKGFKPDVASFLAYLFAHDAHHRGQISLMARLLGHPVSQSVNYGMWEWGTR